MGVHSYTEIKVGNCMGGVISLPVTPGSMSGHLAGKLETTEHEPSETLGHVQLSTITRERTRPTGRRVVVTKTASRR